MKEVLFLMVRDPQIVWPAVCAGEVEIRKGRTE